MGLMDSRNALGMASPQDQQFARRSKANVESSLPYQNFKQMVNNPIDQVSDIYALMNGQGGQQEADNIVRRAGEGLMGMGGYVKSGGKLIPHNNPEVVHAYRKMLNEEFSKAGKQLRTTAHEYPDYTNIDMELLKPNGDIHVMGTRRMFPEGIENTYLLSRDQATPSGLLPVLYPGESGFMQKYGGDIWSTLDGEKTNPGWLRSHKGAVNEGGNKYRKSYSGDEDFPLKSSE